MIKSSFDYPGRLSYDEITIAQDWGSYAIAVYKGPEKDCHLEHILIIRDEEKALGFGSEWAYGIDKCRYKKIAASEYSETVIRDMAESLYFRGNEYVFVMSK